MTVRQKETLLSLGMCYEWILDGMTPPEFKTLHGFNIRYVEYVKQLRDEGANPIRNLLDPDEDSSDITAPPYVRAVDSFHPLDDGTVDVRVTLNLNPTAAGWLEDMLRRLPLNFPNQPRKHGLGYVIKPMVMDAVKNDGAARNGNLAEGGGGTVSSADFANLKGPQSFG